MTWRLFTGALSALRLASTAGQPTDTAHGPEQSVTLSAGISGPARNMSPACAPAGKRLPDPRARAERLCNRSPRLVARYLETQAVLMTGRGR